MARQPKFIVKARENRSSPWSVLGTYTSHDDAVADCPRPTDKKDYETAVFHEGKITNWFRGGKDVTANSRQAPAPADSLPDDKHRYFVWRGKKNLVAAQCVAREADTARRLVENAVLGWDFDRMTMEAQEECQGPTRIVALRPEDAYMKEDHHGA